MFLGEKCSSQTKKMKELISFFIIRDKKLNATNSAKSDFVQSAKILIIFAPIHKPCQFPQ